MFYFLTLNENVYCTDNHERPRFTKVLAFHLGRKLEMVQLNDVWQPVSWKNRYQLSSAGQLYPSPNFQLILEYRTPKIVKQNTHFSKMLDTQLLCDVHFIVKGKKMGAHLAVMAAASPVMAAMFEPNKFKEGRSKCVTIQDMKPEVFEQMLRYVYTGEAPKFHDLCEDLFLAADKYNIDSLKGECEQYLSSKLDNVNAIQRLILSHYHHAPALMEASLEHLNVHQEEIWDLPEWKQLVKKEPDVFFLASHRMSVKENRKTKMEILTLPLRN